VNELRLEIVFTNPLSVMEVAAPALGQQQLTLTYEQFTITAIGEHSMFTLPADHTVLMQVTYVDAKGNPATIDGNVTWESSDASIVSVTVDTGDSSICRAMPVAIGQAQITAACDADLCAGVRELLTLCDIEVIGGEAVAGVIQPLGELEPTAPHVDHRKK